MYLKKYFFNSFTQSSYIPYVYSKLIFNINNSFEFENFDDKPQVDSAKSKALSISLFPSYFTPIFSNQTFNCYIKKISQKNITGFGINIDNSNNIELFLKNNYKKAFVQNIKRYKKRLETCFNITYKTFYGDISKQDYDKYMFILKSMLEIRFKQIGENNRVITNWNFYYESIFKHILEKKASISVIFSGKTPISICINRHYKKILYVSIPAQDINYSKFSLGNIAIYKNIEWAIENNYSFVDLEYGHNDYKKRWSTFNYTFDHHLIYPKNNIFYFILFNYIINEIKFKNFLKKYNIDKKITNFKRKRVISHNTQLNYKLESNVDFRHIELIKVNLDFYKHSGLQKLLFDFLFKYKKNINEIDVYKSYENNVYFIDGNDVNQKISFYNKKIKLKM